MLRRIALSSSSYIEEDFEFNYNSNYLTIGALQDGLQVSFGRDSYYSIDGSEQWVKLLANTQTPLIDRGHCISFKSSFVTPETDEDAARFTISKRCCLLGNCMSIIYNDEIQNNNEVPQWGLAYLFFQCSNIVSVSEDFLPATVLNSSCYSRMFSGCTKLKNAPKLPATTLAHSCYLEMFNGCSSLQYPIELPAINLTYYCYWGMFRGCSSLKYIKAMFVTDHSTANYTNEWVVGVSPTGTFVKNSEATWDVVGINGVPEGWTIEYADV